MGMEVNLPWPKSSSGFAVYTHLKKAMYPKLFYEKEVRMMKIFDTVEVGGGKDKKVPRKHMDEVDAFVDTLDLEGDFEHGYQYFYVGKYKYSMDYNGFMYYDRKALSAHQCHEYFQISTVAAWSEYLLQCQKESDLENGF